LEKDWLSAGLYYAGFSFTSFFYAFSTKLKDSHRIGVTAAIRQKFDRQKGNAR
jgi:hypothetical protein